MKIIQISQTFFKNSDLLRIFESRSLKMSGIELV